MSHNQYIVLNINIIYQQSYNSPKHCKGFLLRVFYIKIPDEYHFMQTFYEEIKFSITESQRGNTVKGLY